MAGAPVPLRIGPQGLDVYLGEYGQWLRGTYRTVPWAAIAALRVVPGAGLLVVLTPAGRRALVRTPGRVGRSIRTDGTLLIPQVVTTDLADAVAHYSGGRFVLGR